MRRLSGYLVSLLGICFLVACNGQPNIENSERGQVFFPTEAGRIAHLPADCFIEDEECPAPQVVSIYPEQEMLWWGLGWSPDGQRALTFVSGTDRNKLLLLQAGRPIWKTVAEFGSIDEYQWSPDSEWIAVAGVREDVEGAGTTDVRVEYTDIYLFEADGSEVGNLTEDLPDMKQGLSWLGEETILFQLGYSDECGIYTLNIHSRELSKLVESSWCAAFPAASPDGTQIVFEDNEHLYIMDANGTNKRLLTELSCNGCSAYWSPDGEWIKFQVLREEEELKQDFYVVHADGSGLQKIYEGGLSTFVSFAPESVGDYLLVLKLHESQGTPQERLLLSVPDGITTTIRIPGYDEGETPQWMSWRPGTGEKQ
jgi:Tol biopolymer transport system component